MPSRIITPPDHFPTKNNLLIINALDSEVVTLVLWLKTIPESFDIHLYHNQMDEDQWLLNAIVDADQILVSEPELAGIKSAVKKLLDANKERIIYFGKNTEFPDLIHFFLSKREIEV